MKHSTIRRRFSNIHRIFLPGKQTSQSIKRLLSKQNKKKTSFLIRHLQYLMGERANGK